MTRLNIKWITTILTRLLYFVVASVLLVALLTTLERSIPSLSKGELPSALLGGLASSSQAANLHHTPQGTWTTYNTSNSELVSDHINAIAVDEEGNKWFGTNKGVSKFDGTTSWETYDTSDGLV